MAESLDISMTGKANQWDSDFQRDMQVEKNKLFQSHPLTLIQEKLC